MARHEIIIKDTHRGPLLRGRRPHAGAGGRPARDPRHINLGFYRRPRVQVVLVNVRQRDLTIKGQEILTADKVAIRVSIIVQFRVVNPRAALHEVESYEDRLYGDVQLAARRSLASMALEEILTNRNRLSDDILQEVDKSAGGYGVSIARADVKDLVFPGNLQEIMNRVLAAERNSQAQLVEARTRAEVGADRGPDQGGQPAGGGRGVVRGPAAAALSEADAQRITTEAEIRACPRRSRPPRRIPATRRCSASPSWRPSAPWPPPPTRGSTSASTSTRTAAPAMTNDPERSRVEAVKKSIQDDRFQIQTGAQIPWIQELRSLNLRSGILPNPTLSQTPNGPYRNGLSKGVRKRLGSVA